MGRDSPGGPLLRLARVRGHGLRYVDVVAVAVVGVHSVGVWWGSLVGSPAKAVRF